MSESTSYAPVRRVRKHITNLRHIIKEMSAEMHDRKKKIVEARWGGEVPVAYYKASRKRKKAETEPMIL